MTTFCLIRPAERLVMLAEAPSADSAAESIGLDPAGVDHGVVEDFHNGRGISIIVDEWSLMQNTTDGLYYTLNKRLYNGPAVLYYFDHEGKTVNFPNLFFLGVNRSIRWLGTAADVERAIVAGEVSRPQQSINGKVIWEWRADAPSQS